MSADLTPPPLVSLRCTSYLDVPVHACRRQSIRTSVCRAEQWLIPLGWCNPVIPFGDANLPPGEFHTPAQTRSCQRKQHLLDLKTINALRPDWVRLACSSAPGHGTFLCRQVRLSTWPHFTCSSLIPVGWPCGRDGAPLSTDTGQARNLFMAILLP
ncbi:hypothetical protein M433DRAFT_512947 [Acidomyces richmondensis BFW]|nr:MAG: hypothetical protein FE78DRAFT_319815 [Acidomyces sp. 'richmondensis']KYG47156.1 hypothetical protein M433DRAFT_512947 [Acidomyces richmondensis BFW]